MRRVIGSSSLVLILMLLPAQRVEACTVFAASHENTVLFGNNEDWKDQYSRIWFLPAEEGKYGRMYLGFDRFGVTIPQGGINDQGLAFDILAGPRHEVRGDPGKERYQGNLVTKALEECASVEEVLAMYGRYNHEGTWKGQYFFADGTGDAAIIEGDVIHRKKGRYQVATNFYLSQYPSGEYPCWRYNTASEMLKEPGPLAVDLFRRILESVSQQGSTPTVYSNIFDLQRGFVTLYLLRDFESAVTLELEKELKKGPYTVDIASLFPNRPAVSSPAGQMQEPVSRLLQRAIDDQGVSEAIEQYRQLQASEKSRYDYSERVLNIFGIDLVYMKHFETAIKVLSLVVEEHPQSANAYDSLAWAYMKSGQVEPAIVNYEKSLQLNPENANAVRKLEELRGK